MRIYTRTGDGGETSLGSGLRVAKCHPRVAAYGELDEVNSWVGLLRAQGVPECVDEHLQRVQRALFSLGSILTASPKASLSDDVKDLGWLEQWIDSMWASLPPLTSFILPGGCRSAGLSHVARAVTRRAERSLVASGLYDEGAQLGVRFLNRLSDALFVLARWLNFQERAAELPWRP
ncbi:MAG: cob(I)yrinic acid a,c-diamide adenosyltransferase [Thermoanaerobaculaceae bacterium]